MVRRFLLLSFPVRGNRYKRRIQFVKFFPSIHSKHTFMMDTADMTDILAQIKIDDFLKKPVNMPVRSIECNT
jgi:hypothetical protein